MAKSTTDIACPCRSGKPYADCCAPAHGGFPAASPEALMRSRYAAFVLRLEAYLLATWHPRTRPADVRLVRMDPPPKWLGLEVRHYRLLDECHAEVEFIARHKPAGAPAVRLHERSQFVREEGCWYYTVGDFQN